MWSLLYDCRFYSSYHGHSTRPYRDLLDHSYSTSSLDMISLALSKAVCVILSGPLRGRSLVSTVMTDTLFSTGAFCNHLAGNYLVTDLAQVLESRGRTAFVAFRDFHCATQCGQSLLERSDQSQARYSRQVISIVSAVSCDLALTL